MRSAIDSPGEGRRLDALQPLDAEYPDRLLVLKLDVTKRDEVEAVVAQARRLDVVINNAGYGIVGAVEETPGAEMRAIMETNFSGAFNVTQAGDPAKAAAAIDAALKAGNTPLRLQLGNDSVDMVKGHAETLLADLTTWESAARDVNVGE